MNSLSSDRYFIPAIDDLYWQGHFTNQLILDEYMSYYGAHVFNTSDSEILSNYFSNVEENSIIDESYVKWNCLLFMGISQKFQSLIQRMNRPLLNLLNLLIQNYHLSIYRLYLTMY